MSSIPTIRRTLPSICSQQQADNKYTYGKYFIEGSSWAWYVMEYSSLQKLYYGYISHESRFGYFTVEQLEEITYRYGVDVQLKSYIIPR